MSDVESDETHPALEARDRLDSRIRRRNRISTRLYVGIGLIAVLTLFASLVAWLSFNDIADVQTEVNERSVPEMAAAFGVAKFSGELVAAAPQLADAPLEDVAHMSTSIDATYALFEGQLSELERTAADLPRQQRLRVLADDLIANIEVIESDLSSLYALGEQKAALQRELVDLREDFDSIVTPAIDTQIFFTITGYRDRVFIQASSEHHFNEQQFLTYRYLAELQSDANVAAQLLASALTVSDAAQLEPLRERFESIEGRIERSVAGVMGEVGLQRRFFGFFERVVALGGDQGGFDIREAELELLGRQSDVLARNQQIAVEMLNIVNELVADAENSVAAAAVASRDSIVRGRFLLLALSAVGLAGAGLIVVLVRRSLVQRLARLSVWMRKMAAGDLEATERISGHDEVADMAAALEVFRQHALEVQRLNLVELLADELKEKNEQLEVVLADLQAAQDQIVMREKLAALGELTAGVAHEIRNPLNFVKNFSEVSQELLEELGELLEDIAEAISEDDREYMEEIMGDLTGNLERILSHGDRANRIVQDMLMMGRDVGEWQFADINRLVDEHSRLAFHAARAADPNFNLTLNYDLDPKVGSIEVIPRDLSRVFLNMVGNACDATDEKRRTLRDEAEAAGKKSRYIPNLWMSTHREEDHIEVRIKDNGKGIPPDVIEKMFNPFFTTKPTDRGTGLGLAISNDIIREHGGEISVESEPGEWTQMTVSLPLTRPREVTT